jgi:hypothetical protein
VNLTPTEKDNEIFGLLDTIINAVQHTMTLRPRYLAGTR